MLSVDHAHLLNQSQLHYTCRHWRAINHHAWATDDAVNLDVFLAYIDHGNAKDGSYEYTVVPNVSSPSLDAYSKKPAATILSNTPQVQAVSNQALGITQAVFYVPGQISLGDGLKLSAQNPCIVMVKKNGKKITTISVADPTHKLSSVKLKVNARLQGSGTNWTTKTDKESEITIQLPTAGYAGQTVIMEMK